MAVQVYEAMDKADTIAAAEANSLSGLTFESAGLPADVAGKIRIDVDDYIGIVTNKEWPRQRSFTMDDSGFAEGWAKLREITSRRRTSNWRTSNRRTPANPPSKRR